MHKARLLASGKIGALKNLLVHQVKLVHGRFLTQGEIRNYHMIGVSQVEYGIQKMGLSFAVLAADDHPIRLSILADHIHSAGDFLHDLWPCFGEIFPYGAGRNAGAQGFYYMPCFYIIHLCSPPALHFG